MNESTYHALDLLVQIILVLVVLFGGGKWVGQTTQLVKSLIDDVTDHRKEFGEHRKEDKDNFKDLSEKIGKLEVRVAAKR